MEASIVSNVSGAAVPDNISLQFQRYLSSLGLLSPRAIQSLHEVLSGRKISLSFGGGVDSTAMMVALKAAGVRPDLITMADTGGEKPETWLHVEKMRLILRSWNWPEIDVVRKVPMESTPYRDLYGNCISNETLPSLAFGMKSCSIKWKQDPQDKFIKGVKSGPLKSEPHPLWVDAQRSGERIVKLIGYDCGRADKRRSAKPPPADSVFEYSYPLQCVGWIRSDCVMAITATLGSEMVPIKSACFFCPASKEWELYWLAAHHPNLLEDALKMEFNALTGRHSRFESIEFGVSWEEIVRSGNNFPSAASCVGLGRSFSWCQWAVVNHVVDDKFRVHRDPERRQQFIDASRALISTDNAHDFRRGDSSTSEDKIVAMPRQLSLID